MKTEEIPKYEIGNEELESIQEVGMKNGEIRTMKQKEKAPAMAKSVDKLTEKDFLAQPVWEFINDDEIGELFVRPIKKLPAMNLDGRVVGCQVTFSNGSNHFAMLGNVDSENPKVTRQFLSLSIWEKGKWLHLSRYFDPDYHSNGPDALSKKLGLIKKQVFPISYDIRQYSKGVIHSLVGEIPEKPMERLSQKDRMALSVP